MRLHGFLTKVLVGCWVLVSGFCRADVDPHSIEGTPAGELCVGCHVEMPKVFDESGSNGAVKLEDYRIDGIEMCTACHEHETGHEVNVTMNFAVPADLPLGGGNTLICLSCHRAHGKLTSNRPWASVSFMDRLTNDERLTKTFLLRRNNSNGELCLVCHNPEGGEPTNE